MGINLSDIVAPEPRTLEDFPWKVLAIDASNTLYLSAPAYDQHRLSRPFTALINAMFAGV